MKIKILEQICRIIESFFEIVDGLIGVLTLGFIRIGLCFKFMCWGVKKIRRLK